ncbi:hypothetical protein ACIHEI_29075 [Kitasatospora sp. NPDC051984]|uniref:hypothetical protein n=1 Tax=Kitasatospora sp. NPDC051984 TaxID=3364059 RepID=UPI0037C79A15
MTAEPVSRQPLDDERIDRRLARIRELFARWAALRPGDGEVWRTGFSALTEAEVVEAETRLGLRLPEQWAALSTLARLDAGRRQRCLDRMPAPDAAALRPLLSIAVLLADALDGLLAGELSGPERLAATVALVRALHATAAEDVPDPALVDRLCALAVAVDRVGEVFALLAAVSGGRWSDWRAAGAAGRRWLDAHRAGCVAEVFSGGRGRGRTSRPSASGSRRGCRGRR